MPSPDHNAAPVPTTPSAEPRQESPRQPRRQPLYNVVLLDDDQHSYEYVIEMLQKLFAASRERALQLAKEVDAQKRAILLTTTLEHAELKQEQVHEFGPDKRIASCQGSMTVVLEPIPTEGA